MYKSCIETHALQRRTFDPGNKKDINEFRYFMANHQWPQRQCPFYLEWPYLTIPDMIKDKFARYTLGIDGKNVDKP
jgi:hypothetical protein